MTDRIEYLKNIITEYDEKYRTGNVIIGDSVYDSFVDELENLIGEDDEFFVSSIKKDIVSTQRRDKTPIIMASMNKCKTIEELHFWFKTRNIDINTELILMPKYDGISLSKDEEYNKAWTRGGRENNLGIICDEHIKHIKDSKQQFKYTYGEAIILRDNFEIIKDSFDGDSARNAVSGLFRRDDITDELEYVNFIKYGAVDNILKIYKTKAELLDTLNKYQSVKVPYKICKLEDLNETYFKDIFKEWSKDVVIDGIIVEINDLSIQKSLGREKNNNPKYARAYKGDFEETKETIVTDIVYDVSKKGYFIPVAHFEMIILEGAKTRKATLNNYEYMKTMKIGVGSKIKVKRSGMVIPLITSVLTEGVEKLPEYSYIKEGVHLKATEELPIQKIKKISFFLKRIGVENVSTKSIETLYNAGFTTLKSILEITVEDLMKIDKYQITKAKKTVASIRTKLIDIQLSILQHATGLFDNLGSKKLKLLEHFDTCPTIEDVIKINGFSEISAKAYVDAYDEFFEYIKDLPVTYKKGDVVIKDSNELENYNIVFSGFRDKSLEQEILKRGGSVKDSINQHTNILVLKKIGEMKSKEVKAKELGKEILDIESFIAKYLNK